jgi:hypothetical protein
MCGRWSVVHGKRREERLGGGTRSGFQSELQTCCGSSNASDESQHQGVSAKSGDRGTVLIFAIDKDTTIVLYVQIVKTSCQPFIRI